MLIVIVFLKKFLVCMYVGAHIHVQYLELCEECRFYSAHSQICEK